MNGTLKEKSQIQAWYFGLPNLGITFRPYLQLLLSQPMAPSAPNHSIGQTYQDIFHLLSFHILFSAQNDILSSQLSGKLLLLFKSQLNHFLFYINFYDSFKYVTCNMAFRLKARPKELTEGVKIKLKFQVHYLLAVLFIFCLFLFFSPLDKSFKPTGTLKSLTVLVFTQRMNV